MSPEDMQMFYTRRTWKIMADVLDGVPKIQENPGLFLPRAYLVHLLNTITIVSKDQTDVELQVV